MPRPSPKHESQDLNESQRIDIWLFRARFFKTRSLATKMVSKGKIRVTRNGQMERTKKPNALIRPGDEVLFMRGETLFHLEVLGTAARRGPFSEAQTLYNALPSQP